MWSYKLTWMGKLLLVPTLVILWTAALYAAVFAWTLIVALVTKLMQSMGLWLT